MTYNESISIGLITANRPLTIQKTAPTETRRIIQITNEAARSQLSQRQPFSQGVTSGRFHSAPPFFPDAHAVSSEKRGSQEKVDIHTKDRFFEEVKDLSKEDLILYVKTHSLPFLDSYEALKVRKCILGKETLDRSRKLTKSLVIFFDGTIFETGKKTLQNPSRWEILFNKSRPIGELIGRGSYKEVYKVQDLGHNNREYAIGTVLKCAYTRGLYPTKEAHEKGDFEKNTQVLIREYELSKVVTSLYICKLEAIGVRKKECGGVVYTKSELCSQTLGSLLSSDPLYLYENPGLLLEIVSAIVACHEQNIAHLDIAPKNILIDFSGHARVADFGESKENATETQIRTDLQNIQEMIQKHYMDPHPNKNSDEYLLLKELLDKHPDSSPIPTTQNILLQLQAIFSKKPVSIPK